MFVVTVVHQEIGGALGESQRQLFFAKPLLHVARQDADDQRDVQKRLGDEELTLRLTPAATDFLVDHGYDEHFGARPLKRAIQKYVEDPLSEKILVGEFARGDEVEVDVAPDKERLAFRALSGSKA